MKKLLFLLVLTSISFIGCDGKERVHLSNTEVLKQHKILDSFSEKIEYIPEQYSEINTDTILSNGFRVKLKAFVDMENSIMKIKNINSLHYKTFYRNRIINLYVEKNDKQIFSKIINNNFFIENIEKNTNINLKNFVLSEGYTTYDDTYVSDKITFTIFFKNFLTDESKSYQLEVNNSGKYRVFENKIEPETSFQ